MNQYSSLWDQILAGQYAYRHVPRAQWFFANPNHFGAAIAVAMAIFAGIGGLLVARSVNKSASIPFLRNGAIVLSFCTFGLLAFMLGRTMSRGAFAGILVTLAVGSLLCFGRVRFALLAYAGIFLTVLFVDRLACARIHLGFEGDLSVTHRWIFWINSCRILVAGHLNEFGMNGAQWTWFQATSANLQYQDCMNDVLTITGEYGRDVGLLYLAFTGLSMVSLWRAARRTLYWLPATLGLSCFHLCGLVNFLHDDRLLNLIYLILSGAAIVALFLPRPSIANWQWLPVATVAPPLGAVGLTVLCGWCLFPSPLPINGRRVSLPGVDVLRLDVGPTNDRFPLTSICEAEDLPTFGRWVVRTVVARGITMHIYVVRDEAKELQIIRAVLGAEAKPSGRLAIIAPGEVGVATLLEATRTGQRPISIWTDGIESERPVGEANLGELVQSSGHVEWHQVLDQPPEAASNTQARSQAIIAECIPSGSAAGRGAELAASVIAFAGMSVAEVAGS